MTASGHFSFLWLGRLGDFQPQSVQKLMWTILICNSLGVTQELQEGDQPSISGRGAECREREPPP